MEGAAQEQAQVQPGSPGPRYDLLDRKYPTPERLEIPEQANQLMEAISVLQDDATELLRRLHEAGVVRTDEEPRSDLAEAKVPVSTPFGQMIALQITRVLDQAAAIRSATRRLEL